MFTINQIMLFPFCSKFFISRCELRRSERDFDKELRDGFEANAQAFVNRTLDLKLS